MKECKKKKFFCKTKYLESIYEHKKVLFFRKYIAPFLSSRIIIRSSVSSVRNTRINVTGVATNEKLNKIIQKQEKRVLSVVVVLGVVCTVSVHVVHYQICSPKFLFSIILYIAGLYIFLSASECLFMALTCLIRAYRSFR